MLNFGILNPASFILSWGNDKLLCDFQRPFCSVKILMQKLLMKMSLLVDHKKAQSIDLSNKICFVQIGQVVPELSVINFTYNGWLMRNKNLI